MHSVKPFGNSTLSCGSGSIATPPECPWIALKYDMCLEELGFKQFRILFLAPPPFCQNRNPIIEWPLRSTLKEFPLLFVDFFNNVFIFDCSVGFPRNILIMSLQSDHCFWYDVARMIISSRIDVHPLSFAWRNGDGCQRYCWFHSRSCFGNRFPWSSMLFVLNRFCRLVYVLFKSIYNSDPRGGSVLKHRSDLNLNTLPQNTYAEWIPKKKKHCSCKTKLFEKYTFWKIQKQKNWKKQTWKL